MRAASSTRQAAAPTPCPAACTARRTPHHLPQRRPRHPAGSGRQRRQEEHRYPRALLAGPEVLRYAQVRRACTEATAARQGGAVPGPDRQADRRGHR
ncbi:hypothetical protein G6F54_014138 [Rhizopus delemar]|nr:hypothetical protein G6F54_014138 [Rhizopus delemar]